MKCGLLGRKLGHSYSPQIHALLGNYSYELYETEPEDLKSFLNNSGLTGFNVTIPYKKDVLPYLDDLSDTARKLGAVNTVVRRPNGTLFGHNTDYFGFRSLVLRNKLSVEGKKALVFGSGGASNTAVAVLQELGARVTVISRSGENNYQNLYLHQDAAVLVNTTPLGMYPNTGFSPVDMSLFPKLEGVLDVIYNPAKTKLLLDAEKRGIPCANGLWMLVAQAKESAEYFTGTSIPDSLMEPIFRSLSQQMQNIILIGMPGCGKTTVANALAQAIGKKSVDSDQWIVEKTGKSIPQILADAGESIFREIETEAIGTLGKTSGCVIATGGGCVTRPQNLDLLRQNGLIVWLVRDLEKLPIDGRPLSQANPLPALFAKREPLYRKFADCIADNNGTVSETVNQIMRFWEEKL